MQELSPLTPSSRIFVAGHRGPVGAAIVRRLQKTGYLNLILAWRDDLDLRDQAAVSRFFARQLPEFVFLAASRVGGILAKATHPAEFLYDNLAIETNVIHAAWQNGAQKLVFLGSSSLYPQLAPQHQRRIFADIPAGAGERSVCHREDCGAEAGGGVS